jgi:hypothetical protein
MVELPSNLHAPKGGGALAGAIPLDSPVAQALRDFTGKALTSGCVALVAIAITEQGQVLVARVAPGGVVQSLGMIALGKHMVLGNATPAVQQ